MAGLYIHIPFCAKKCIYCDFYSVGFRNVDWGVFVNSIINELRNRKKELTSYVNTIYIGGGTPSLIPISNLRFLINVIKEELQELLKIEEFTIEVNPDDVNDDYVIQLKELGITRISMGVQSFCDSELQFIKRRHTALQAINAYKSLSIIGNISLDLIFGLPGQTLETWNYSLDKILELRPHHISAYSLMYEQGTTLYKMREQGKIVESDDDISLEMFEILISRLKGSGYKHYEISNFALDGYESRHNSSYWSGVEYLGLGPSAHSYDGGSIRRYNPSSVKEYMIYYSNDFNKARSFYVDEILTKENLYNEYVMTRMRKMEGISIPDLRDRFEETQINHFIRQSQKHISLGNLIDYGNRIGLSEKGVLISDTVFVDLIC